MDRLMILRLSVLIEIAAADARSTLERVSNPDSSQRVLQ
jgi:hypothetical protein